MRLLQPDRATALLGLRAMKMVATAGGRAMGPSQRTLLDAARRIILKVEADIDGLPPLETAELAAAFPSPEIRLQFVDGMLVLALADGVPSRDSVARIEEFAEALGVRIAEVTDLRRLAERHMLLFKLDFLRRSQIGEIMRNQLDQHGVVALAKSVLGLQGLIEDKDLAARYRAWEKLPEGTLGRSLVEFYRQTASVSPANATAFPRPASTTTSHMCWAATTPARRARSRSRPSRPVTSTTARSTWCCSRR
jgi:hypothetical protein